MQGMKKTGMTLNNGICMRFCLNVGEALNPLDVIKLPQSRFGETVYRRRVSEEGVIGGMFSDFFPEHLANGSWTN
jgi:hypothetical protein